MFIFGFKRLTRANYFASISFCFPRPTPFFLHPPTFFDRRLCFYLFLYTFSSPQSHFPTLAKLTKPGPQKPPPMFVMTAHFFGEFFVNTFSANFRTWHLSARLMCNSKFKILPFVPPPGKTMCRENVVFLPALDHKKMQ